MNATGWVGSWKEKLDHAIGKGKVAYAHSLFHHYCYQRYSDFARRGRGAKALRRANKIGRDFSYPYWKSLVEKSLYEQYGADPADIINDPDKSLRAWHRQSYSVQSTVDKLISLGQSTIGGLSQF